MMRMLIIGLMMVYTTMYAAPERLTITASAAQWEGSMRVLRSQVGVIERGRNDGTAVRRYLASVGLRAGAPWCWALQYWTYVAAGEGVPNAIVNTGSTQTAWHAARRHATRRTVAAMPQDGDLMVYYVPGTWSGHGLRIESVRSGGWLTTIEGNTSSGKRGSQRDGDGVYRRHRNWLHPLLRMRVRGFIGREEETTNG